MARTFYCSWRFTKVEIFLLYVFCVHLHIYEHAICNISLRYTMLMIKIVNKRGWKRLDQKKPWKITRPAWSSKFYQSVMSKIWSCFGVCNINLRTSLIREQRICFFSSIPFVNAAHKKNLWEYPPYSLTKSLSTSL